MPTVDLIYRCEPRGMHLRRRPLNSGTAVRRLDAGNRSFVALLDGLTADHGPVQHIVHVDPCDLGFSNGGARSAGQKPFAAILGCSDARVPVELIFGEGPNDIFVIRVAGNVLGSEALGSLHYAVEHLANTLKLIVVLGHSGCGAVSTAVDLFLNPRNYLPLATAHCLRGILDSLLAVIQACAKKLVETFGSDVIRRPGYRKALVEAAIVANAALCAYTIRKDLEVRRPSKLMAVYGVYLLESREVWTPSLGGSARRLADAPRDQAAFHELGNAIVRSERITSILDRVE